MEGDVAHADPLVGAMLSERYRLTRKIGEGGMGAVYEATHVVLNKTVAVKLLRDKYLDRPEIAERLVQEARHASSIHHPHIVDVTDSGRTADGRTFLVMELLSGQNLAQLIREQSPIPEARAVEIVRQVASALSAAHERRILHRDVKPDNVILVAQAEGDFVKVVDFGISKSFRLDEDEASDSMRLTNTGVILGTPLYMSPEQARGEENLDHRADIYALGVILYECLTGEVPFRGVNYLSVLSQVATQEVRSPRQLRPELQLSDGLDRVVGKAMAKAREDRYQTMAAFEADLARLSQGRRVEAQRIETRSQGARASEGFRFGWGVGVALLGLVIVGALTTSWLLDRARADAQREAESRQRQIIPTPVAAPPPPLSATVGVHVISVPPGAEVRLGDRLLGHAPDELRLPRGTTPVKLDVMLDGYRPTSTTVVPSQDGQAQVSLLPLQTRGHARRAESAARKAASPGHDATSPQALPSQAETLPNPY